MLSTIGEEAVVLDAMEAFRQHVHKKERYEGVKTPSRLTRQAGLLALGHVRRAVSAIDCRVLRGTPSRAWTDKPWMMAP